MEKKKIELRADIVEAYQKVFSESRSQEELSARVEALHNLYKTEARFVQADVPEEAVRIHLTIQAVCQVIDDVSEPAVVN